MSHLNHSLIVWALPRKISGLLKTFPMEMEKPGFPVAENYRIIEWFGLEETLKII